MTLRAVALLAALAVTMPDAAAHASTGQPWPVTVRGKALTLTVYTPKAGSPVKGTIFMGSGDVGWVGLATTLAEFLSDEGYVVAGINVRQYLAAFVDGGAHLQVEQVPADFEAFAGALKARGMLARPVILAGVSEGAALAVAAAATADGHRWVDGVVTMGLPATAELAWRWKDALTWVTKSDADEPSFSPHELIANVAPLPLWMIQSTRDEYVPEPDYRRFERMAAEPKRLVLIDAKNHRFTDKLPELKGQLVAGIDWIRGLR
ncbi:MAG: AcvB/VirJ family lysyl-phosphatidylglycerol hydrolase [Acidobacteriota bacterium]